MSTADEYTPTTEEVIRGYRLPRPVVDPQREDESFADYISRASIEGHGLQVQSEAAARRWLEGERARARTENVEVTDKMRSGLEMKQWGVQLDDAGSMDVYDSEEEAREYARGLPVWSVTYELLTPPEPSTDHTNGSET